MNQLSRLILTSLLLLLLQISPAALAGHKEGNGGDMCEDRIKVIRDDIASWIQKGGSKGLKLSDSADLSEYNSAMLKHISSAQISCTSEKVLVGGVEKTCKNSLDETNTPQIICNAQRFIGTGDSDQYILVHHEYAGLAGFEATDQGDSHYEISNQISGYLENQVVKKLVVKPSACNSNCVPPDTTFEYDGAKLLFDQGQVPNLDALTGTWKLVARAPGPNLKFYSSKRYIPVAADSVRTGYDEKGLQNEDESVETLAFTATETFDGKKSGRAKAYYLGDKSRTQDPTIVAFGPNGAIFYTYFYYYTSYYPILGWYQTTQLPVIRTCKLTKADKLICVLTGKGAEDKIHSIEGFARARQ
jgi:hypothetical protein